MARHIYKTILCAPTLTKSDKIPVSHKGHSKGQKVSQLCMLIFTLWIKICDSNDFSTCPLS